jgi:hypothetical protein
MPANGKLAHHDFAVDKIFGATETYKTDFQRGNLYLCYQGRSHSNSNMAPAHSPRRRRGRSGNDKYIITTVLINRINNISS